MTHSGMESITKLVDIPYENGQEQEILAKIWYGPGKERFYSIAQTFYRECHGFAIVFNISDLQTFHNVQFWLEQINSKVEMMLPKFLIGNMVDREEKREISKDDCEEFAYANGLNYFETSALTGEGINEVFNELLLQAFRKKGQMPIRDTIVISTITNKKKKKRGCC